MILYGMLDGQPPWAELNAVAAVKAAALEHDRPEIPRHWDGAHRQSRARCATLRALGAPCTTEEPLHRVCAAGELSRLLRDAWADTPGARPSFAAVLELLERVHTASFKMSYEEALARKARGEAGGAGAAGCCSLM